MGEDSKIREKPFTYERKSSAPNWRVPNVLRDLDNYANQMTGADIQQFGEDEKNLRNLRDKILATAEKIDDAFHTFALIYVNSMDPEGLSDIPSLDEWSEIETLKDVKVDIGIENRLEELLHSSLGEEYWVDVEVFYDLEGHRLIKPRILQRFDFKDTSGEEPNHMEVIYLRHTAFRDPVPQQYGGMTRGDQVFIPVRFGSQEQRLSETKEKIRWLDWYRGHWKGEPEDRHPMRTAQANLCRRSLEIGEAYSLEAKIATSLCHEREHVRHQFLDDSHIVLLQEDPSIAQYLPQDPDSVVPAVKEALSMLAELSQGPTPFHDLQDNMEMNPKHSGEEHEGGAWIALNLISDYLGSAYPTMVQDSPDIARRMISIDTLETDQLRHAAQQVKAQIYQIIE